MASMSYMLVDHSLEIAKLLWTKYRDALREHRWTGTETDQGLLETGYYLTDLLEKTESLVGAPIIIQFAVELITEVNTYNNLLKEHGTMCESLTVLALYFIWNCHL